MYFSSNSPTKVYKNKENMLKIEIHMADVKFYFYFRSKDDTGKTHHGLRIKTPGKQLPWGVWRKHHQYNPIITVAA